MTSKSGGLSPPLLADSEKFDGTNYLQWRETILMACRVRGARGYLEGTILNPAAKHTPTKEDTSPSPDTSKTTTTPSTPAAVSQTTEAETLWTSLYPSAKEWDARDAWCLLAIAQNVKNAVSLGLKTDGTAAEAWASLEVRYKTSNDLVMLFAKRELQELRLLDGGSFPEHMAELHIRHKCANTAGANIRDAEFCQIILMSLGLPNSWDTIITASVATVRF